jgi:signal transduction histidine kinase
MLSLMAMHVLPGLRSSHPLGPTLAGLTFMGVGVLALRQTLVSFGSLRKKLLAVRIGEDRRVAGRYPAEIQPLIDELNALLEDREQAVRRAIATAGDLAHGLKTPLALLAQEADRAGAAGNIELAESIAQQVERMSRQVTYHLARARAAASGGAGAAPYPVAPCIDALLRTLGKLYASRTLKISANISPDLCARVQPEDLEEMLGNLLDNACKWANSQIVLEATRVEGMLVVTLNDDGPGLALPLRSRVLERGVRLDESAPGSGLGLAIVRDLAELYHGSVSLEDSPLGGLQARVCFPAGTGK